MADPTASCRFELYENRQTVIGEKIDVEIVDKMLVRVLQSRLLPEREVAQSTDDHLSRT